MSLAQVGALYGIGAERVRQLFFTERLPTRHSDWHPPSHPGHEAYVKRLSYQLGRLTNASARSD